MILDGDPRTLYRVALRERVAQLLLAGLETDQAYTKAWMTLARDWPPEFKAAYRETIGD